MKAIKMTAQQVNILRHSVFVRFNFTGEFFILLGLDGHPFESLNEAQTFLREHFSGVTWEISTLEQALMDNGMRDNL